MGIRYWIQIALALVALPVTGRIVYEYRRGRRSLPSTIGWVLFLPSYALEKGLPFIAPSLTGADDVFSSICLVGLLIIILSWVIGRGKKAQPS